MKIEEIDAYIDEMIVDWEHGASFLPKHWEKHIDQNTKETFYYNSSTKESQRESPGTEMLDPYALELLEKYNDKYSLNLLDHFDEKIKNFQRYIKTQPYYPNNISIAAVNIINRDSTPSHLVRENNTFIEKVEEQLNILFVLKYAIDINDPEYFKPGGKWFSNQFKERLEKEQRLKEEEEKRLMKEEEKKKTLIGQKGGRSKKRKSRKSRKSRRKSFRKK